ncbi:MAG: gamma-glutamyl-gamma-aminobutyrate hydrolase family protein [Actinomycetota bacterium]
MHALVIGNREDADVGVLGEWAAGRGLKLVAVDREGGELPPFDGASLVVSLGSVWRVHDPELAPLVQTEQGLLREAVAAGVPVLGICFGMQQLTVAFGGEVYDTPDPELGFGSLVAAPGSGVPTGPWMQFHYDACRLPARATELARNDHGLQAYRLGSALAVQFHPEVDRPILERWAAESRDELREVGRSPEWLIEEAEEHAPASRNAAFELFEQFWAAR